MLVDHPDEGTIHAWLDGGLPAAMASEIEAHVRACAPCQAAVAEARGFIAAASRILSALDDVPAHVIPPRVAVKPRRLVTRWPVQALAAAIVVAIGLTILRRPSSVPSGPVVPPMVPGSLATVSPALQKSTPVPRAHVAMDTLNEPKILAPPPPPVIAPTLAAKVGAETEAAGTKADAASAPSARQDQIGNVMPIAPRTADSIRVRAQASVANTRLATAGRSAAAAPAMIPRLATHCDSLRLSVARTDSARRSGSVGTDSVTTAQRDSAKACKKTKP